MKNLSVILLLSFFLFGCGGNKAIKGIAEREMETPPLEIRPELNPLGYNHFINGTILEVIGDIYTANAQYEEALKYFPNSAEIRFSYANTFLQMRHFRKAINEAIKIRPLDGQTWFLLAKCYRSLGNNDSAMIAFRNTVSFEPDEISAYYQMAPFYEEKGLLDSAVWAYNNIARLSANYKIYGQIANLYLRLGKAEPAEENYLKSLDMDSTENNIKSYLGLTLLMESQGDTTRAHQYILKAAGLAPYDIMVQNKLLDYYQDTRQLDKAIKTARTMVSQFPRDVGLKQRLGLIYFNADSLTAADSIFSSLVEAGKNDVITLYYAGRTALELDSLNRALDYFSSLTIYEDTVVDGWLNLGWVYGRMDSSLLELTTYLDGLNHIKNLEDSVRLLYAIAVTHEKHGNFDQSVETFEKVIKFSPGYSQAMNYLGYMLTERGTRLEYARDLIEKALKIQPNNGAYIDSYGWVLYKLGEYNSALEELLKAYKLISNDAVINEHIAEVYRALGDIENAQIYLNRAIELDPGNESLREMLEQ